MSASGAYERKVEDPYATRQSAGAVARQEPTQYTVFLCFRVSNACRRVLGA